MITRCKTAVVMFATVSTFACMGTAIADGRVRVAHFAPFASILEETSVTIAVDGDPVLENFVFGEFSDYLNLPAGSYAITVTPTGATEPAITGEATVADDTDYTIAAVGNGLDQPLALLGLVDDNSPPTSGNLKLRVVHAAPFADSPEATAVSIRSDDGAVIGDLESVPYGEFSEVLEIPAGIYDLKVATPDGRINLIDAAPVDLPADASITVFAIGDGNNQPLGLTAMPVGELALEAPANDLVSGHWYNPETPGQGIGFHPVPEEDRIFGTWYTYGEGGVSTWYALDTCVEPGTTECNTIGFNGTRAIFAIVAVTGGAFDQATELTREPVGELTVDFESCRLASAFYTVNGQDGSFDLVNLTPIAGCTE